jgi:sugar lactone lactonase YvrE
MRFFLPLGLVSLLLSGCGFGPAAPATQVQPGAIQGKVHGGQQAVVGAHVYLYAANTTGYNIGSATNASVSLLNSNVLTNEPNNSGVDSNGNYYVTTDVTGSFNISNDYSCTPDANGVPGQQVYVYAVGGNPGSGDNPAASFMAVLGDCPAMGNFSSTPYVWVNEVSTVAAAYAIAGFAYDSTHVSSSGTDRAKVGIQNAFANAANLASLSTGFALTTIPSGNATVPQTEINSLANILAACVNTSGAGSSACTTLFSTAESTGSSGTVPGETATAMINIAHNPAINVGALFSIPVPAIPFVPALPVSAAPDDFSISLNFFTISGLGNSVSIDAAGNLWMVNGQYSIIKLSSSGYLLSGSNGYTDGLNVPGWVAIDVSGDAWVGQNSVYATLPAIFSLFEFSNSGDLLSPADGYTGGGLDAERDIAIDGQGNIWTTNISGNSVSKFSSQGVPLSGSGGFTASGMNVPLNIAVDASGNAWITNYHADTVVELSSSGSALSGAGYTDGTGFPASGIAIDSTGNVWVNYASNGSLFPHHMTKYSSSGQVLSIFTGAGVPNGLSVAIDGADNIWSPNYFSDSIGELSNSGAVRSGPNGYVNSALFAPWWIAIDGSGNAWVNGGDILGSGILMEYIGIAVPVVTPLSEGVKDHMLGTRP